MTDRIGGLRRKTRHKLAKKIGERGKISLRRYLQQFNVGETVRLSKEPSLQKGMYYPRFLNKTGVVKGKAGKCYKISIKDKNKEKTLIVHPIYLEKIK